MLLSCAILVVLMLYGAEADHHKFPETCPKNLPKRFHLKYETRKTVMDIKADPKGGIVVKALSGSGKEYKRKRSFEFILEVKDKNHGLTSYFVSREVCFKVMGADEVIAHYKLYDNKEDSREKDRKITDTEDWKKMCFSQRRKITRMTFEFKACSGCKVYVKHFMSKSCHGSVDDEE